jgi:hypothetical protein
MFFCDKCNFFPVILFVFFQKIQVKYVVKNNYEDKHHINMTLHAFVRFTCFPKIIRYAVLDYDGQNSKLLNGNSVNKLDFPVDIVDNNQKKLVWLYQELNDIFDQYPDIEVVSIKSNEYGLRGKTKSSREVGYQEGVMLLAAQLKGKSVSIKLYSSLKTNGAKVKTEAKKIIESADSLKSFDEKMADAIVVAYSGRSTG